MFRCETRAHVINMSCEFSKSLELPWIMVVDPFFFFFRRWHDSIVQRHWHEHEMENRSTVFRRSELVKFEFRMDEREMRAWLETAKQ